MRSLYTFIQDIVWWCTEQEIVCIWNLCALYLLLWPLYLVQGLLLTQYDESFDMARETWEEQQIFVGRAESSCQYCCSVVLVALLNCNRVQLQLHCNCTQVVSTVTHGRRKSGYWISSLGCYSITEILGLDNQAYYTFPQKNHIIVHHSPNSYF